MSEENVSEGKADFQVGSETYQTWYKVYGDIKNSKRRPIVAVHGGPGMSHHYMLPHKSLYLQAGIPVIFYDQLGNGQSSLCPGVPKEFWTPELFMDQLDSLVKSLDIFDDFDLLGQSWGGMLGAQFSASRSPKGLKRLILTNSPASIPLYIKGRQQLLDKFPEGFAQLIQKHEAEETTSSDEYKAALMQFHARHSCTVVPWPEELLASFACAGQNPAVHNAMYGHASFNLVGSLKDWNIIPILHKIPYPTLLISAPMDFVQEVACLPYFTQIPKVKWVELQNSTHAPYFEEPERYFKVILEFLSEMEGLPVE